MNEPGPARSISWGAPSLTITDFPDSSIPVTTTRTVFSAAMLHVDDIDVATISSINGSFLVITRLLSICGSANMIAKY